MSGRGGAGTVAFHKCVHKAATLATLEASDHPRARAAAKTLRAACFERFPVEWLREVQRREEEGERECRGRVPCPRAAGQPAPHYREWHGRHGTGPVGPTRHVPWRRMHDPHLAPPGLARRAERTLSLSSMPRRVARRPGAGKDRPSVFRPARSFAASKVSSRS